MEGVDLIKAWRDTINGPNKSWVLFENGTCVILMEPEADLEPARPLQSPGPQPGASASRPPWAHTAITLQVTKYQGYTPNALNRHIVHTLAWHGQYIPQIFPKV